MTTVFQQENLQHEIQQIKNESREHYEKSKEKKDFAKTLFFFNET